MCKLNYIYNVQNKIYVQILKKNNLIGYILKYIKFVCTNISSFEIYFFF